MGSSFQDQLLKLGLVDKKQVDEAKRSKHKKKAKKVARKQPTVVDENKLLAEQAQQKKKERARQLNREREEKLKKREEAGRIRQMIEAGRLEKDEKGVAYRFVDNKKIFRLFLARDVVDQLEKGKAGVVRFGDGYEVCPVDVVKKLAEIDAKVVVRLNESKTKAETDEDDPYAGFEVPDDLDW